MQQQAQKTAMQLARRSAVTAASLMALAGAQAATINITSRDAPGVGFNDTTPVAPVGGNPGTTLGAQRQYVYRYVANLWEAALQSNVTINVSAGWEALTCTSTQAVLGSAGAWNIWRDFPNGKPGTWYHQALANKLAGVNLSADVPDDGSGYGNVDIKTQFNVNLGNTGCLDGTRFYLGVDGNAGSSVNFVSTLLHELGHGLGFSVLTSNSSGNRIAADGSAYVATGGLPAVWEQFMFDNTTGKTWLTMSNAERKASAINPSQLVWTGPAAVAGAATTLGNPQAINISTPVPGASGPYEYNTASFGPAIVNPSTIGSIAVGPGVGCDPFDAAASAAVRGKWAILDRGTCGFAVKTKNAQNAGAIGVIMANNAAGSPPGMSGTDATITIPTASITQAAGVTLKAAVANASKYGPRGRPGSVVGSFGIDASRKAGADALGRPLLYTPSTLATGSSVSHWDVAAFPNQLMEPFDTPGLSTSLVPPKDLTKPLLQDMGW